MPADPSSREAPADVLPVIPRPFSMTRREGVFTLSSGTAVVADEQGRLAVQALKNAIHPAFGDASLSSAHEGGPWIAIQADVQDGELGGEGYRLHVAPGRIDVIASTPAGAFYGVQTLLQLLPADVASAAGRSDFECGVPCLEIFDRPQFPWRGLMLDTARHFFTVEEIRRFIDQMVIYKFNVFHWHLVDDQGWRLEIRKYPELTAVGSWRDESPLKSGTQGAVGDGVPYGGFYTQDQVRELVRYAAERFVTILPEIEMPGHASAAIAAYPWLGNEDVPGFSPKVATSWGMKLQTFSPRETTFAFLEDVLVEVMALFPSTMIHIGGDEAAKDQWNQSPSAQEVMKANGIRDAEHLQSWFLRRIQSFLARHGKEMIGWDEIQEGGLAPGATMMVWRDVKWAQLALDAGNDVVMSPMSNCYFDHYQGPVETEPEALGQYLPLEKVYGMNPLVETSPEAAGRVLGVQGNVWTESISSVKYLDYMTYPRACALAEVGWSAPELRDWTDFLHRLNQHVPRLDARQVAFRPISPCLPWK